MKDLNRNITKSCTCFSKTTLQNSFILKYFTFQFVDFIGCILTYLSWALDLCCVFLFGASSLCFVFISFLSSPNPECTLKSLAVLKLFLPALKIPKQSCSLQDTGVPATLEMPLIRQSATGQLNQFLVVNLYLCFYFSLGKQLYKRLGPGWNWNKVILFQHPFTYAVRWRAFPKLLA